MEFSYYFHYVRNLKYQDRPDYSALKSIFYSLLVLKTQNVKNGYYYFDWFEEIKSDSDSNDDESSKSNKVNNEIIENEEENHSLNNSNKEINKKKNSDDLKNHNIDEKGNLKEIYIFYLELNILSNLTEKKEGQFIFDKLKTKVVERESDNESGDETKRFEQSLGDDAINNILGVNSQIEKELIELNKQNNNNYNNDTTIKYSMKNDDSMNLGRLNNKK